MKSNKSSKKYLLIFDFDQSIVDQDSEYEQVKMTLSEAEYNKMVEMDYYDGFNYYFKKLKEIGLTLKDLHSNLEKLELSPKMEELFKYLSKNKSKYDIIILSSYIDYSIKHVLKVHGFLDLFDDFLCNKAEIPNNKSQQLLYVPRDQFPHSCDICMPSQCKSCELEKYLNKKGNIYKKILFVCDGSNDFCPTQKILKQGDIVFPRAEHSLIKKLSKKSVKSQIACEIFPWKNADEIIIKLKDL